MSCAGSLAPSATPRRRQAEGKAAKGGRLQSITEPAATSSKGPVAIRNRRINESFTTGLGITPHGGNTVEAMSALAIDLRRTTGYIVADRQGRLVGKVECPMYGTAPDVPDALSVKSGLFSRRRRLVPADTIDQIDGSSGVIGLRVDRENIRSFL